jgi:hypothetical protein
MRINTTVAHLLMYFGRCQFRGKYGTLKGGESSIVSTQRRVDGGVGLPFENGDGDGLWRLHPDIGRRTVPVQSGQSA